MIGEASGLRFEIVEFEIHLDICKRDLEREEEFEQMYAGLLRTRMLRSRGF